MTKRLSFGIAALLLAAGVATYLTGSDDEKRTHRDSADEEPRSEPPEASRRADSFPTTTRQPPVASPDPAEPVAEAALAAPVAEPAATVEPEDPEPTLEERVQLIRLPVISAIRASHATPTDRYHAMRKALERSGPSSEPWTREAPAMFESWSAALPKGLVSSLGSRDARCFLAGCEVEVRFESQAAYEQAAEDFRSISDNGQHGGRVQTPPIQADDGTIVATWMMLRPNVAPPEGSR